MTNPLDPALFRPDAVTPETRALNQAMVHLLTPMPDWWVTGAEASRAARRRGDGPFPAPVMSARAQTRSIPGKDGAVIVRGSERYVVDAHPIEERVDTTGAGDLFAAGFLFGYTQGRSLEDCAKLGNLAAAIVIEQIGPRPMRSLSEAAREFGLL